MPPRKRARTSRGASALSSETPVEPLTKPGHIQTPVREEGSESDVLGQQWTDEQEILLFKSMIRWKPVGSSLFAVASARITAEMDDLMGSRRHAQTLPDDSDFPESQTSWLCERQSY